MCSVGVGETVAVGRDCKAGGGLFEEQTILEHLHSLGHEPGQKTRSMVRKEKRLT